MIGAAAAAPCANADTDANADADTAVHKINPAKRVLLVMRPPGYAASITLVRGASGRNASRFPANTSTSPHKASGVQW